MKMSWHGKDLHITGPLWGESAVHWWVLLKIRARNVMLWYFQCCKTEQAVQQSVELAVILNAMMVMWHHCDRYICSREIWVKVTLDDPWACSLMDQSFLPAHWTCHCATFFGLRDCITGEKWDPCSTTVCMTQGQHVLSLGFMRSGTGQIACWPT